MQKIKIYQVDAFTGKLFGGNPAAVCILDKWLDDELMQNIGAENNLAETAFIVPKDSEFEIRWFTPSIEVELCGHATLASAFVVFEYIGFKEDEIIFNSPLSGVLKVKREKDLLTLDFPADGINPVVPPTELIKGIAINPVETYKGKTDYMAVLNSEEDVRMVKPDFQLIGKLEARGLIVTAPGDEGDFVSRFFAPQSGIDEDPVTGSAHTTLIPYWSMRLGKKKMVAKQISKRTGTLYCTDNGLRVKIGGYAKLYMVGEIYL